MSLRLDSAEIVQMTENNKNAWNFPSTLCSVIEIVNLQSLYVDIAGENANEGKIIIPCSTKFVFLYYYK